MEIQLSYWRGHVRIRNYERRDRLSQTPASRASWGSRLVNEAILDPLTSTVISAITMWNRVELSPLSSAQISDPKTRSKITWSFGATGLWAVCYTAKDYWYRYKIVWGWWQRKEAATSWDTGRHWLPKAKQTWMLKTCPTVCFPQPEYNLCGRLWEVVPIPWYRGKYQKIFPNGRKRQEWKQWIPQWKVTILTRETPNQRVAGGVFLLEMATRRFHVHFVLRNQAREKVHHYLHQPSCFEADISFLKVCRRMCICWPRRDLA